MDILDFLGEPPVVTSQGKCTLCGKSADNHGGATGIWLDKNDLREFHRKDFSPNGWYSDEDVAL